MIKGNIVQAECERGDAQLNMEQTEKLVHVLFKICKIPGYNAFMWIQYIQKKKVNG